MNTLFKASLFCVLASVAFAEHRRVIISGTPQIRNYGSRSGFGNIVFPGTGNAPSLGRNPFSITDHSFAHRLGLNVAGYPLDYGGFGRRGSYSAPIPYPIFVGGYGYDYGQQPPMEQPAQNITIIYPPQSAPVIQGYAQPPAPETARPSVREYGPEDYGTGPGSGIRTYEAPSRTAEAHSSTPTEQGAASTDQVMFMIALKDNSVYTAVAYWVEGATLHFITTQGDHHQVRLDQVDRDVSTRLNKGRRAQFRLPAETR